MIGQSQAGPWVDDVRIAAAADLDVLPRIAGRGNRNARQRQPTTGWIVGPKPCDGNPPSLLAGRRITQGDVAAGVDQCAGDAGPSQHGQGFIHGVALADPSKIDQERTNVNFYSMGELIGGYMIRTGVLPGEVKVLQLALRTEQMAGPLH